ncbi:hypothetical protein SAMN04488044_1922 [Cognatishimia maritima]|uniref:Uncharacterized protein n=1 Tax=Cognatishimia maritima TaxID=870908 RepID=A0A1M5QB07_9RHOB|nr:hypothetical protein SAMN04488044_1922 [Cognatishimia maritima]
MRLRLARPLTILEPAFAAPGDFSHSVFGSMKIYVFGSSQNQIPLPKFAADGLPNLKQPRPSYAVEAVTGLFAAY